ncbi:hypothetical protein [Agrococcus sp. SGAir0287]|uniref:hypothetical protein n=1 Tax=Agrococcus sp. SGAir0287 TaxID=2070347 RepID=UPI0010CCF4F8|nr:hypothetical protein [Agrococcus sp. SGAir0287]QCR18778.1 hypothetical protein C1N71_04360 [Agrococcus sp. SGAir0287]
MTVDHRVRWTSGAWRADMHQWIRVALADRGETVTRIDEHRVRIWSAVLRIETDAGVRWAKENHPGSASEMAATAIAHRVAPGLVLEPLAIDVARARLLTADAGVLHEGGHAPIATRIALGETMGRLQRALEPHADELVAAGVPDIRPARVVARLRERVAQAGALPPEHPLHLDDEARAAILARVPRVDELLAVLADAGIPASLEHDDLHLGNAFEVGGALRIGDLGDAVVAHPFGTLRVLLGSARARGVASDDLERIRAAYLAGWRGRAGGRTLERAADAAIALSGVQRWEAWWRLTRDAPVSAVDEYRPYVQPLLRTLGDVEASLTHV